MVSAAAIAITAPILETSQTLELITLPIVPLSSLISPLEVSNAADEPVEVNVVDLCFGCQCRDILCIWHRQISPNTVSGAYRKRRYLRGLSWVVASEHGVE